MRPILPLLSSPDASGSAAVALPAAVPADSELPQILDFLGGSAAVRRQHVDCWSDLSGAERARIDAKVEWMRAVWAAWRDQQACGRGSLEAAVAQVRLDSPQVGAELATAGKLGAEARTVRNFRFWAVALGRRQSGEPEWDNRLALRPDYGRSVPTLTPDQEAFWRDVCKLWLRPEAPRLLPVVREVARVWRANGYAGDELLSERQIRSLVKARLPLSVQERYRGGARVYNARSRGYVARRCNVAAGEAWFLDHRVSDFWIRMPHPENPDQLIARRPWCTMVTDAATGYMVAVRLYLTSPNHERIAETLQGAIVRAGMIPPRIVYTDQGADFRKEGLTTDAALRLHDGTHLCARDGQPYAYSLARSLRTEHWLSAPYNGKEKPVERHLGSVAQDFDRTMPGYCGRSPQYRPDPDETYSGDVRLLCSLEQACERLDGWAESVHHQVRFPDGRTRGEAWAARPLREERRLDERSLFFALLVPQPEARIVGRTSVGPCGVRFDGWMYSHIELRAWQDKPVMVKTYWGIPRVDRKGREVPAGIFVFAPDDRFICAAPADPVGDMFAETDEARQVIGRIQHLINAASAMDRDTFQRETGLARLAPSRDHTAALIGAVGSQEATVQIAAGQGNHRRLPAAEPPAAPEPPRPKSSPADAALLERLLSGRAYTEPVPPAEPRRPDAADFALLAELTKDGV